MKHNTDDWFKHYLNHRLTKSGRKKKIHTQAWLAQKVGVRQQYISQIKSLNNPIACKKEETRRSIVKALEDTYETAYYIGMQLLETGNPPPGGDGVTDLEDIRGERRRIVQIEHQKVIDEFDDFEMGLEFNRLLTKLEKLNKARFKKMLQDLQFEVEQEELKQREETADSKKSSA